MTDRGIGELAKALAAAQKELPAVAKSKTANTGKYSYSYADLADVSEAVYPILSKHGLSFTCCPDEGTSGPVLVGRLMHTSGEYVTGVLPLLGARDPQSMGSALTYARRYLLGAMTGVVTDDDDDGSRATAQARKPQRPPKPAPAPEPMTDSQRKHIFAMLGELGITDEEQQRAGMSYYAGREIASRSDLTKQEAAKVIDALEARKAAA